MEVGSLKLEVFRTIMRFDLDTYKEILDTITRNKTRSLLTGFGVFWGVFMLIGLMGGGGALEKQIQKNFMGYASNTATIFAHSTTKPYKGFSKGRTWTMEMSDIERLRQSIPELDVITPLMFGGEKSIAYGDKSSNGNCVGVYPEYTKLSNPELGYGRYINEIDIKEKRKVCVIGKEIYQNLFPKGGDPCGKSVRMDSTYYKIVGVDFRTSYDFLGEAHQLFTIPQSVLRSAYNRGDELDMIATSGKKGIIMSTLSQRMRECIARRHTIDPTDEMGVIVFNTEVLFQMLETTFKGVNLLTWLVGIGTILAGAIGVSNIMMVTVKERTTEIGIRRAIGATPKMILSQIVTESILLTLVAGMSGILFGVTIMQMLEMWQTKNGVVTVHFQVNFWMALFSAAMVCLLGGLAGLAPAWRAMHIKPVDAMRDE